MTGESEGPVCHSGPIPVWHLLPLTFNHCDFLFPTQPLWFCSPALLRQVGSDECGSDSGRWKMMNGNNHAWPSVEAAQSSNTKKMITRGVLLNEWLLYDVLLYIFFNHSAIMGFSLCPIYAFSSTSRIIEWAMISFWTFKYINWGNILVVLAWRSDILQWKAASEKYSFIQNCTLSTSDMMKLLRLDSKQSEAVECLLKWWLTARQANRQVTQETATQEWSSWTFLQTGQEQRDMTDSSSGEGNEVIAVQGGVAGWGNRDADCDRNPIHTNQGFTPLY